MDSFNDFYLLRSVVLSLSLWHTKTPHFLNSIPYCLTNGGHFTTLRRKSFYFLKKQKKKHQAFLPSALCGAPPGTRTLGPLIKRNQRATIVNFQNCVKSLFLSFHRKFAFCICCILCTCYPLLHPLSSRSGVQKVCKNVQSQNQHLKTGIGFLCNGVKTGLFHPAKGTLYITNLYHTSNVHQQFDSWQGYGQSN